MANIKYKGNLLKVTIELKESGGRPKNKVQRKGCTAKLLGWFAEDATPMPFHRILVGSQVPVDIGHHMLNSAALAHLILCTPDSTMATIIILN